MAKRPKVAPVNYQVPFSTTQPDVVRTRTEIDPGMQIPWYLEPALMAESEVNRWKNDPMGRFGDIRRAGYSMIDPVPSTKEAVKSWGEFTQQPSWKRFGGAVGNTAMAGLDWSFVGEGLGKAGKLAKVARLGRY